MADTPPGDLTTLLQRWTGGDAAALDRIVSEVYAELRAMAARCVSRERASTVQATVLVHELYMRLLSLSGADFQNRRAFFGFAANVMRHILVDTARTRGALKRGGGAARVPLSDDLALVDATSDHIIDLSNALDELAVVDPRKAELVQLCAFLGCSREEAADLVGVSRRTALRDFRMARAWLSHRLGRASADTGTAITD